jgi:hypothetical protein
VRRSINGHINFRGPDEERLVQGRERIYLDRFYNELSADPKTIDTERGEVFRHRDGRRTVVCRGSCEQWHRPHSGHWIMEENPQATVKIVTEFLAR